MNIQKNIKDVFYLCSNCKAKNRIHSRFCRSCGYILEKSSIGKRYEPYDQPLSSDVSYEDFHIEDENFSDISQAGSKLCDTKDKLSFFSNLRESYNMEIDDLSDFLSYQQYLFETTEKGLAVIHNKTGHFIAVNSRFEEITGFSRVKLYEETFTSLIPKVNKANKKYDMEAIIKAKEFVIFSNIYEKLMVKVIRYSGFFQNNSILISLDYRKDESKTKIIHPATRRLNIIAKIAEEINRSLDIETILSNTLEKVKSTTRSDVAIIMFIDKNKKLFPIASSGISKELIENLKALTIESDTGTRAKALSLGKTVEADLNEATSLTGRLLMSENLLSMATVPLKAKDEVIGIMSVGSRKKENFSEHMELLDVIGNQVAIAIKNSRLYIQVKDQLKELKEKNKKLEELEEAKKQLTRMIIHDLKSPLTGIMAYSEYLQGDNTVKDAKLTKIYHSIYTSSQDILRMVMNLLEISKMEEKKLKLKLSQIDLREIIDNIKEEMRIKLLKKNIDLVISIPDKLQDITVDKDLFHRIMTNLLDNAIKYSVTNDIIEIKITVKKKTKHILFSITDEGKGIPEKYRKKIFESFFKLDSEECGITTSTGIGLTFCKLAVEAHGGKIWVKENIPKGSKFCFTIPVNQGNKKQVMNV